MQLLLSAFQSVPDPREPDRVELSHGRGIFLMHELMDALDYRKHGREVVLFKGASRRKRPSVWRSSTRTRRQSPCGRMPNGTI